jgi:uncharacterized protein (TIGR02996 family)
MQLLNGERDLLAAVVANLRDDNVKLVYADWLENRDDDRGVFLREYVEASRVMRLANFPKPKKFSEEWLELIGFRIVQKVVEVGGDAKLKTKLLKLARPALRLLTTSKGAHDLPVGASKIGGFPDLPPEFEWPQGHECKAIYNSETDGVEELAGFVAQVNFAEITETQSARSLGLPSTGILSLFSYTDADDPDVIGALARYIPDVSQLRSLKPSKRLEDGNKPMRVKRLTFAETLDLPESYDGPWAKEMEGVPEEIDQHWRGLNFHNMFGYSRSTSGGDPTPNKQSRHLIVIDNCCGCKLHIQLPLKKLLAHRFDTITLNWVDFD